MTNYQKFFKYLLNHLNEEFFPGASMLNPLSAFHNDLSFGIWFIDSTARAWYSATGIPYGVSCPLENWERKLLAFIADTFYQGFTSLELLYALASLEVQTGCMIYANGSRDSEAITYMGSCYE